MKTLMKNKKMLVIAIVAILVSAGILLTVIFGGKEKADGNSGTAKQNQEIDLEEIESDDGLQEIEEDDIDTSDTSTPFVDSETVSEETAEDTNNAGDGETTENSQDSGNNATTGDSDSSENSENSENTGDDENMDESEEGNLENGSSDDEKGKFGGFF